MVWSWVREQINRRQLQAEAVLGDLYVLARQHREPGHGHPVEVLRTMAHGHGGVDRSLMVLKERGLVQETGSGKWALTPRGMEEAGRLSRQWREIP